MQNDITLKITRVSNEDTLIMDNTDIMLTDISDFSKSNISITTQSNTSGDGSKYLGSYADKISRTIKARITNESDYYKKKLEQFLTIRDEYIIEIRYKDTTLYARGYLSKYSSKIDVKSLFNITITFLFPSPFLFTDEIVVNNFKIDYGAEKKNAIIFNVIHTESNENIGCKIIIESSNAPFYFERLNISFHFGIDRIFKIVSKYNSVTHTGIPLLNRIEFDFGEGYFNVNGVDSDGNEQNLMKYIDFSRLELSTTKVLVANTDLDFHIYLDGISDMYTDNNWTTEIRYNDQFLII